MRFRGALVALAVLAGTVPATADDIPLLGAKLTQIGTLSEPTAMAVRAGDERIFITEKSGRIRTPDGGIVLDLSAEVSTDGERGLLGVTFSPTGSHLYVDFTDRPNGRIHVTSFAMSGAAVDLASRREILVIDHQPYSNHNGGALAFGPDGFLYISTGDGGGGGDPLGSGQNLGTLLGKMLRINPLPSNPAPPFYSIPAGNPFVATPGAKPEIWSYGLRNPWRFSFDRLLGDIWIGDVGQNLWEEIDHRPSGSPGGENYGWNRMEGNHPYLTGTEPDDHVPPLYEYPHTGVDCSVTGGYVYRGSRIPTLAGRYLFADFCAGRVRALFTIAGLTLAVDLNLAAPAITSFGQDAAGEIYVLSYNGGVYRIDPA